MILTFLRKYIFQTLNYDVVVMFCSKNDIKVLKMDFDTHEIFDAIILAKRPKFRRIEFGLTSTEPNMWHTVGKGFVRTLY